jgi:hypothetical protein
VRGINLTTFCGPEKGGPDRWRLQITPNYGIEHLQLDRDDAGNLADAIRDAMKRGPLAPGDTSGRREFIQKAAIRVDGKVWSLPRPARHHVIARAWSLAHHCPWPPRGDDAVLLEHESGFVTDLGRFVSRKGAETIARAAGQVEGEIIGGVLTTEDLW